MGNQQGGKQHFLASAHDFAAPDAPLSPTVASTLQEENDKLEEFDIPQVQEKLNQVNLTGQTRRLKRRAPSSTAGSSTAGSIASSNDPTESLGSTATVTLKDFDVLTTLGRGSQGTVYLVRHKESTRLYAMKTIRKSEVLRKQQSAHVWHEFKILASLAKDGTRCPYIVPMRFAFHSQSRLFLVFEYCPGGELYFHLGRKGRLPEYIAKFYCAEIAVSIGYLHACGIVYRDLKPENLMLDTFGHINLIDFGLSKEGVRSHIQGIQGKLGTIEYLPPEIHSGVGGGLGVDWWAMGMLLYEMLIGVPPWYDHDRDAVVSRIMNDPLQWPTPDCVSSEAMNFIEGLLQKDPSKRTGCRGGGASEVLTHAFFRGVDWVKVAGRSVEPPFVPPVLLPKASNNESSAGGSLTEDEEQLPGICNFEHEYTSRPTPVPPARDFMPPQSGDKFEGFFFDFRQLE